jgi:hypothetical protein
MKGVCQPKYDRPPSSHVLLHSENSWEPAANIPKEFKDKFTSTQKENKKAKKVRLAGRCQL